MYVCPRFLVPVCRRFFANNVHPSSFPTCLCFVAYKCTALRIFAYKHVPLIFPSFSLFLRLKTHVSSFRMFRLFFTYKEAAIIFFHLLFRVETQTAHKTHAAIFVALLYDHFVANAPGKHMEHCRENATPASPNIFGVVALPLSMSLLLPPVFLVALKQYVIVIHGFSLQLMALVFIWTRSPENLNLQSKWSTAFMYVCISGAHGILCLENPSIDTHVLVVVRYK
mmetsp:Transcript_3091/g.5459  ORF Transcript_3091/g.5459 Transcript_3091/m.5459 type:complete len:225 (-) Transcript_3091:27-701(-)